jgi:hypothetical protein
MLKERLTPITLFFMLSMQKQARSSLRAIGPSTIGPISSAWPWPTAGFTPWTTVLKFIVLGLKSRRRNYDAGLGSQSRASNGALKERHPSP